MNTTLAKYHSANLPELMKVIQRHGIGMDDYLDRFFTSYETTPSYPPYNIVKETETKWRIELALAGWSADQVEVSTEQNVLLVKSKEQESEVEEEYMHRGVAARNFTRTFNISDDVEIGEVKFVNGLLTIELQKIIPDHQKKRVYDIG